MRYGLKFELNDFLLFFMVGDHLGVENLEKHAQNEALKKNVSIRPEG